jgi:hypothetical protein
MKNRGWLIVASILVVVSAIAAAGVIVLKGGDSAAAAVTLEPANWAGADPFSASVQIGPAVSFAGNVQAITTATRKTFASGPKTHTLVATGTAPGLYGGSGDIHVCNSQQLVTFLQQNPAKATAWAGVLGISAQNIASYVAGLTPVILTNDTLVTNHGYHDGHATTLQSVLEAGTAVMVDNTGTPRVKCNCGNPLTPPELINFADVRYRGTRWYDYSPTQVTTVDGGTTVTNLTVININTGETYTQPTGNQTNSGSNSAPSGTVSVTPCPYVVDIPGSINTGQPPPPTSVTLPPGISVPAGAKVYAASSDSVLIAPAHFTCTARMSEDDLRQFDVVDPANKSHFVAFSDGGSFQDAAGACSYLATERDYLAQHPVSYVQCPAPPSKVAYTAVPTGDPRVIGAVIAAPAGVAVGAPGTFGVQQPQTNDVPTYELSLAHWSVQDGGAGGNDGATVLCALPASDAAMCAASIELGLANSHDIKQKAQARAVVQPFLAAHTLAG